MTDQCTTEWFKEHGLAGVARLRAEVEAMRKIGNRLIKWSDSGGRSDPLTWSELVIKWSEAADG